MNLPNTLSLIRLCLVPVFAWAYFLPQPNAHLWAALVYAAAFVTDIADGYIARRFDLVTKLGRILDPLADKLMTLTVITCVTADGILPIWAVVVFFCKEAAMGLGGLYLYRQIKDMPPSNWLGKTSTGVFFVVLGILVLFPISRPWATGLITLALALAVGALLRYAVQCFHLVKETP
ncbi:CDP-alcohol phosphatidyltransferase family protein [Vermiculatibacterium agrestimuris]|uniref:CDP-alcohol phosphatidyltransferase family protein n=1 Tax=Vermiculatibacterium agrestimuris TaxID=2941519 RepID=UPI002041719C|nr:CDP-alcohol phosphatidyltransferase family protein [Vermiculatibacterium agrestimuris]